MTLTTLDQPHVLRALFHPRQQHDVGVPQPGVQPVTVAVAPDVRIGGQLYPAEAESPAILYFHGNGEIAADYDSLAPMYTGLGISLLVVDYRGYGRSDGTPTASHLLNDAVATYQALGPLWAENDLAPQRLYVMGRSLGSAAAAEVGLQAGESLSGLIIESGFADTFGLLARLGLRLPDAVEGRDGFNNGAKLAQTSTRTLVIHGQNDVLIPPSDGQTLYQRCAAPDKTLVLIPGAGHNDLMMVGMAQYFEAIREFVLGEA